MVLEDCCLFRCSVISSSCSISCGQALAYLRHRDLGDDLTEEVADHQPAGLCENTANAVEQLRRPVALACPAPSRRSRSPGWAASPGTRRSVSAGSGSHLPEGASVPLACVQRPAHPDRVTLRRATTTLDHLAVHPYAGVRLAVGVGVVHQQPRLQVLAVVGETSPAVPRPTRTRRAAPADIRTVAAT